MQDRLTMTGYCRYGNHVFPITCILSFGSVGHTLLRMGKVHIIYSRLMQSSEKSQYQLLNGTSLFCARIERKNL